MQTRALGSSDNTLSVVGLGTNYVGGHNLYANVDEDEGVRLVQQALDLGVTHIDTADVYGTGRSEELVGKAIAGRRNDVILATKGGNMFTEGRSGPNNDPKYLRNALELSLKRLNVDHVDLYYIHRPDGVTPPEDAYGELMRFKDEGLIGSGGLSNFDLPDMKRALTAGAVDALQSQYNLLQRQVEAEILPFCQANNIAFVPWGPLAYGLLGGKYTREYQLPENDWRHRSGVFGPEAYSQNMDIVDGLKALAAQWGAEPAHIAVQWLLGKPSVGSVITGAKTTEQVVSNVASSALSLSSDQLAQVDALVAA
ncbi:MAG: myo-inositol catabolism protein IolS [Gammaproteobacteria bacterium]|jgi:myo-inositol catabolism protein IolS